MDTTGPALILSLKIAFLATVLTALVAIPFAFWMARFRFAGKWIVESALILPLVLPPTVVGYLVLIAVGAHSPIGRLLHQWDYSLLLNWHGGILTATIVAFPLLYMPAKAAFASIDRELELSARLLGANVLQVFWHISLPLARRGIASGLILAFARALGEFGATVMVMGDLPHQQTLPILIYTDYVAGDLRHATAAVLALVGISASVIVLYNRLLRTAPN